MEPDYDTDDNEVVDVTRPGNLGRVRYITADRCEIKVELRNGQYVTATCDRPFALSTGDVVIINEGVERAPNELWVEETWVGVVKLKLDDVTVVDGGARWRLLPTNANVEYAVGNTVEVDDLHGVIRVLSRDPIRFVEFGELDESVVNTFKPPRREPEETFDDFGGLGWVKKRALELIEVPLIHHDRLARINARPIKGVLFTGPPGTGKTMLARIIANRSGAEFLEISGPQFISKWVGQSEEILRLIFNYARKQERCIIFFDEIDSVAGQRNDESHESSRRVVAQLLTLMDGFSSADNVIVIAATNRPQDIDVALLRPGRFDWEIEFPYPDLNDREDILRTSQKRHQVCGELPHAFVALRTEGWTGAELAAIWTEAAHLAVTDGRDAIRAEDYIGGYQLVATRQSTSARSLTARTNR